MLQIWMLLAHLRRNDSQHSLSGSPYVVEVWHEWLTCLGIEAKQQPTPNLETHFRCVLYTLNSGGLVTRMTAWKIFWSVKFLKRKTCLSSSSNNCGVRVTTVSVLLYGFILRLFHKTLWTVICITSSEIWWRCVEKLKGRGHGIFPGVLRKTTRESVRKGC
jgi:hypothetical protein